MLPFSVSEDVGNSGEEQIKRHSYHFINSRRYLQTWEREETLIQKARLLAIPFIYSLLLPVQESFLLNEFSLLVQLLRDVQ